MTTRQVDEAVNAELKSIGQKIAALRTRAEMSQAELAGKCGWDQVRQSRIEAGKYNLTVRTMVRLTAALQIKASWVIREG